MKLFGKIDSYNLTFGNLQMYFHLLLLTYLINERKCVVDSILPNKNS
jgi:hypothetical protein